MPGLVKQGSRPYEKLYAELRVCRRRCRGRSFVEHRTPRAHKCDARCAPHAVSRCPRRRSASATPCSAAPTRRRSGGGHSVDAQRGAPTIKDTKTHQSRRISLDAAMVVLLIEHRERVVERCTESGAAFSEELFVFSYHPDHARPRNPSGVTHRYARWSASSESRPICTRSGTTARRSCWRPAWTCAPSRVGWATAAAEQRHSRCMRRGSRELTKRRLNCWPGDCRRRRTPPGERTPKISMNPAHRKSPGRWLRRPSLTRSAIRPRSTIELLASGIDLGNVAADRPAQGLAGLSRKPHPARCRSGAVGMPGAGNPSS